MAPAGYIRISVNPFAIMDWDFDNLQPHPRSTKNQIEIAERIEVAKEGAISGQPAIVRTANHLGAAQRVSEPLAKYKGESHREEFVAKKVEEAHRLLFHGVDQPRAIDEFAFLRAIDAVESNELLRRCGYIGIKNHEDIVFGCPETFAYGVTFADAILPENLKIELILIFFFSFQNRIPRVIL